MSPDRVSSPALRGTWIGTILRFLNPLMLRLLDSPLHWPWSRFFMLLSWTGRKTGETRTTPVSYVREGETIVVTTGDRWWRFLPESGDVRIRVRGRWRPARAEIITEPTSCAAQHERIFRRHPWFRILSGIPREARGRGADPAAVARSVDAGRTLVRIDPR